MGAIGGVPTFLGKPPLWPCPGVGTVGGMSPFRPLCFLLLVATISREAFGQVDWNLPVDVSDRNTTLTVAIETANDRLRGVVRALSGRMWLADPQDPTTLRAKIEVPTTAVETGDRNRDLQLRAILAALGVNGATIALRSNGRGCLPGPVNLGRPCEGRLIGDVSFQGIRRTIDLPFRIRREGTRYRVEGHLALPASDFVLSDSLKLLFGFLERVTVSYTCVL
jgi:hypothetical protein